MKHFVFSFLLFTFTFLHSQVPSWQWAQSGTCTTSDNGSGITTDISGNVYTTGYFFGSNLTFSTTTLINAGNYDAYLVKHDNNGNFLWARSIGGAFDDVGNAVKCDNSGNVFVTGYYSSGTMTIGSTTLTNSGGTDVFVAKFDTNGNPLWAKSFGDNMIEEANSITTDGTNIFVTGQFQSNTINFGTGTLTCMGAGDVFVTKYDNNGNEIWAKGFGDAGLDIGYGISFSPGNGIYLTGSFRSLNLTFNTYTLTNMGGSDFFIARYDVNGNEIWAKSAGGNFDDAGTTILCNANGIYAAGYFRSANITFGIYTFTNASVTNADVFLVNYNTTGSESWVNYYGGNFDDIPYGLSSDFMGNIFIGGHIHSTSMTMGSYILNCNGVGDSFIAKLNIGGSLIWAENIGGLQDDGIAALANDAAGKIFATGFYYSSSVNFGPNVLNNTGSADLFIAKLNNNPNGIQQTSGIKAQTVIYPNPASAGFTIMHLLPNATVKIFDLAGKELLRYEIPNSNSIFIDTGNLQQGIYLVNIISGTFSDTQKLSLIK